MLSQFKVSYQRLEQSLQRLTDSIAAYNPSLSASDELVAADAAVSKDLDTLQRHQSNYARILKLRKASAALDEQLRENIQLLADIRRDIKAVPAHIEREDVPEIAVDELLAYAKFISKTSVLPTSKEALPEPTDASKQAEAVNGDTVMKTEEATVEKTENVGLRAVDEQTKRNLDPLKDAPFEPWPSYAVIQQGALAEIQRMRDSGKDPASVLSAEDQAEADRLKQAEEEREREEEQRREMRRMSTFPSSASRAAAQNDVFDPDEA